MNIILGVGTLVIVLVIMTLFLKFAPYGKKVYKRYQGACATFLPQAFLSYAIGGIFHIKFYKRLVTLQESWWHCGRNSRMHQLRCFTSLCSDCRISIKRL